MDDAIQIAQQVLNWLLYLAQQIPATFWGVLIGSFLTLLGVDRTNRAHDRRLETQLTHDREMRKRERELSLRKDIYLDVAESISIGIGCLGRLVDLTTPPNKIVDAYTGKSAAIAKAHVIAGEDATRAIARVASELGAAMLRLMAKRHPLDLQQIDINVLNQEDKRIGADIDRDLELMRQQSIDGVANNQGWQALRRNVDAGLARREEISNERDALTIDLQLKQSDFLFDCTGETKELTKLLLPALVAVRHELEMPIDEEKFREIFTEGFQRQDTALAIFVQQIRGDGPE